MKGISSKKGQINSIAPAIIALMIAAVFLILGLVILQSIRNTDIVAKANTRNVVNETVLSVNEVGDALACTTSPGANSFSISSAMNATNGKLINPANYSVTSSGILKANLPDNSQGNNNTNWVVNYSCAYGDAAYVATNSTLVGLGTFADFWQIIVLAVVITVVIGLLLIVFGGKRGVR